MKIFQVKKGAISVALIVVLAIIAILAIVGIGSYNGIISAEQNVKTELGNIDAALQTRADLIPNLVSTVKGYMKHESDIIDKVTTSREKLMGATTLEEKSAASNELSAQLSRLLAIAEAYPDLKASENFINLQDEIASSENLLNNTRRDYNDAVKSYNTKIKQFPGNIFANMNGFTEAPYFEADESSKDVPVVDFND